MGNFEMSLENKYTKWILLLIQDSFNKNVWISRKSIVMSQKTVGINFFTDRCARNVFFVRESVFLFHIISTQAHDGKSMFSPFANILLLKQASPSTSHIFL